MSDKTFSVVFLLTLDESNNILSSFDNAHEDDIYDLITDIMYDVDDVVINNLLVKERQ